MKFKGYGVSKPQATLTIKHTDAEGRVLRRKRRGLLGRLGLMMSDVQIAHGAVTDAFVALLVDNLLAAGEKMVTFKYHDSGTGDTGELANQTGLITPCGITRATGSQAEPSANVYESVATITYDGDYAVREHAVFDASEAGTMLDRTLFDAVNVSNTEKIEFTYQLTISAGG